MVAQLVDLRLVAATVTDPELPLVTLDELGVLGDVTIEDGTVVVGLLPTYLGCPAIDVMRDDLTSALRRAGFDNVEVRVQLTPAWTSDRITSAGRRKLTAAGIVPPGPALPAASPDQPIPIAVRPPAERLRCPHCGSDDTEETSRFGATACKALHRCRACAEPFEHFKAH